ncbi:hypothetical protein Peur_032890 [Populus x canadensis]
MQPLSQIGKHFVRHRGFRSVFSEDFVLTECGGPTVAVDEVTERSMIYGSKLVIRSRKLVVPESSHVLSFMDQQEREAKLQYRSEKLALAFALLNAPPGPPSSSTRTSEFVVIFIQHSSLCPRWWRKS